MSKCVKMRTKDIASRVFAQQFKIRGCKAERPELTVTHANEDPISTAPNPDEASSISLGMLVFSQALVEVRAWGMSYLRAVGDWSEFTAAKQKDIKCSRNM